MAKLSNPIKVILISSVMFLFFVTGFLMGKINSYNYGYRDGILYSVEQLKPVIIEQAERNRLERDAILYLLEELDKCNNGRKVNG